jgi:hypothetical protein
MNRIYILLSLFFLIITLCYLLINNETFEIDTKINKKKYFITYGGPAENYYRALKRIELQANELNVFTDIKLFNDKDLINEKDFWTKHSEFILNNSRGYGYWLWKSYLNYKIINESNENDIIVYADVGCLIDIENKNKFHEYINILNNSDVGIIVYEMPWYSEKQWTKRDTLKYMNSDNEDILNSGQIFATWFMYKNCENTRKIMNEWYNICSNNYNLIDDSPSINENYSEFYENRHDQSIFSLLCKKYGCIKYIDLLNDGYVGEFIKPVKHRDE